MTGDDTLVSAGTIFVTTNMAAAVACVTTMVFTWVRFKKPDVSMTFNAALGGLVAVTAGCDMVSVFGAAVIGHLRRHRAAPGGGSSLTRWSRSTTRWAPSPSTASVA